VVRVWVTILAVALSSVQSSVCHAQFMYLDANGDGVSSTGDRLGPINTPTTVQVYLVTDHNRDSTPASCDAGQDSLSMNSYILNLSATGGTVAFSSFSHCVTLGEPNEKVRTRGFALAIAAPVARAAGAFAFGAPVWGISGSGSSELSS
jgi:hypothetical protein